MKYAAAFFIGLVAGVAVFVGAIYFNPFVGKTAISPIAVSDSDLLGMNYSAVAAESLVITNDGDGITPAYPSRVQGLWEPTVRQSEATVVLLTDGLGEPMGIGVKMSTLSEETSVLDSQVLVDSAWQVYLPGRGSFFVEQTENLWNYFQEIVIPARMSTVSHWRGSWHDVMTVGPNAIGTARVTGASGEFAGLVTEAVETITARAYSADDGPLAMTGNLTISLPIVAADE